MAGGIIGDVEQQGALVGLGLTVGLNYFAGPWIAEKLGIQYVYTLGGFLGTTDTAALVYTAACSLYFIYKNRVKILNVN